MALDLDKGLDKETVEYIEKVRAMSDSEVLEAWRKVIIDEPAGECRSGEVEIGLPCVLCKIWR